MLGIIGAMDVEVSSIKALIKNAKTVKIARCEFVLGTIENAEVCVSQCSPGKVNAAICTQAMIDNFEIDKIINVGVACSLSSEVEIKNIVVASDVCEYDIDITALGEQRGFINGLGVVKIPTDAELSNQLLASAKDITPMAHYGTIASGDTFIASDELKNSIKNDFDAICGEMEGGAIGHTCMANDVPFAVLRSISDGGNADAQVDYPTFKKIAATMSTAILINYIKLNY